MIGMTGGIGMGGFSGSITGGSITSGQGTTSGSGSIGLTGPTPHSGLLKMSRMFVVSIFSAGVSLTVIAIATEFGCVRDSINSRAIPLLMYELDTDMPLIVNDNRSSVKVNGTPPVRARTGSLLGAWDMLATIGML
jgi:hypothetical protein